MSLLITGATGQLGSELVHLLDAKGMAYTATDSDDMNITDSQSVARVFAQVKPTFVFYCAAYTAVDAAEEDGKALNWDVNVTGTRHVAEACEKVGATLVYISTDYVFDGESTDTYQVDAPVNPQNQYGKAKLAGERLVEDICSNYYIVRTSWVFGQYGKNFVFTMLKLAETHDQLTVVADQIGRPTWTRTLAEFLLHLYQTRPEKGVYQLSNDGSCSWYDFAREILKDKAVAVEPVTSDQYPQKAYRPKHAIMDLSKAKATGFTIPTWQEALAQFLNQINTKG